jgi:hypothetical protein
MMYLPLIFSVDCSLIIHRFLLIYSLYIRDLITPRPGTALQSRFTDGGNSTVSSIMVLKSGPKLSLTSALVWEERFNKRRGTRLPTIYFPSIHIR